MSAPQTGTLLGSDGDWVRRNMDSEGEALGETERGHQQLRDHIAESNRLIGEAEQRLSNSKAIASGRRESGDGSVSA